MEIIVSPAALRDIETILDYLTREAGQNVADKYRRSFLRIFALIAEQPKLGAPRAKLGRGVRMCVVAPYLVLYRQREGLTAVLRILHGRRRITAALLR